MRQTSITAFSELIRKNITSRRQQQVYDAIKHLGGGTNTEIASYLHLPINCITGRTKELYDRMYITDYSERKCKLTGFTATEWRAV